MIDVFPQGMGRFRVGGVEINKRKRVLTAKFGNGYEEVAEGGLNSDESVYDIAWDNVELPDAEIIYQFLADKLRIVPFLIDIPGLGRVQVKCMELKRVWTNSFLNAVTASLQRDYTIVG
jgi:phage-related protein